MVKGRARLIALSLLLGAVVAGCSAWRVGYGLAPLLIMSGLDQTFHLTPAQKNLLRPRVQQEMAWHRKEELPLYATKVEEFRLKLVDGLQVEDVRFFRTTAEDAWGRLGRHIAPLAADFLMTVTPEQLGRLTAASAKKRGKTGNASAESLTDAFNKKRSGEYQKRLEHWVGPLTLPQRAAIDRYLRDNGADLMLRQKYYEKRQSSVIELVLHRSTAAALSSDLVHLVVENLEAGVPPELLARTRAHGEAFVLELFRLSTPAQRHHLDLELISVRNDLNALAGQRS